MTYPRTGLALAFGLALAAAPVLVSAQANEHEHGATESSGHAQAEAPGHSHEKVELHSGEATMTRAHHFETVWRQDGLRIYTYTDTQAPMGADKTTGTVTLKMRDGSSKDVRLVKEAPAEKETPTVYFCPMHPDVVQMKPGTCPKCGGMKLFTQDRLFAPFDLSKARPGSVKAIVHVAGLKGDEAESTFTVTFDGFTKNGGTAEAPAGEKSAPERAAPAEAHDHSHH